MKILLFINDPEVRAKTTFALESGLAAEVIGPTSAPEAVSQFLDDDGFTHFIAEESSDTSKVLKFLASSSSTIPIVLLSGHASEATDDAGAASTALPYPDLKLLARLSSDTPLQELVELLKAEAAPAGDTIHPDYCRIKTELLLKVIPLSGDVFIRLSALKFVKLFKKGDVFEESDLERYLSQKGQQHLYIRTEDCADFVVRFNDAFAQLSEQALATSFQSANEFVADALDTISNLSSSLGFTENVQQAVNSCVDHVMGSIRSSETLAQLLEDFKEPYANYRSFHSVVLSHLACMIAAKMEWNSDSTYEKLVYASLMHDSLLRSDDEARVQTRAELTQASDRFTKEEKDRILSHPQETSESVKKFSELPQDVDTILAQHHERPDGTGFPRGLPAARIAPLASVFIVAHDIVDALVWQKQDTRTFLEAKKGQYVIGNFKRIVEKLLED